MALGLEVLVIVRSDRPDLIESLTYRLGGQAHVTADRRMGERRGSKRGGTGIERRLGDRRQPPSRRERDMWRESGYCVIFFPAPAGEPQEPAPVSSLR